MRLENTARYQDGVFSRRQALDSGLSRRVVRRRLTDGTWVEPASNVNADAGLDMGPAAWRWAAVLACGDRCVISHRSAAAVWNFSVSVPQRPEVSVPNGLHPRPGPQVRVHSIGVPPSEVRSHHGLPVTSRERTVLDCLLTLPLSQGRTLLDRVLQRGWVQLPSIAQAVHDARCRSGAGRARAVLLGADSGTASQAERVAQALLIRGGITDWVAGYKLVAGGQVVATIDLAFPDVQLAIEIDGWPWHSDPERFQEDRRRQNVLVAAGWTVLRFTWADLVERPQQVLAMIASALSRDVTGSQSKI
jgi:hypothetical protein